MGQYIYLTVATNIVVAKEKRFNKEIPNIKNVKEELGKYFCMDLYDEYEDEESIGFELKKDVLDKYLYDFLVEQSHLLRYGDKVREDVLKLKSRDPEEMLQMIRDCHLDFIHYQDNDYMYQRYFSDGLPVYLEGITYLSEGKALLECYHELFEYIHFLIRRGFKNPLKDTVYVTII